jgi:hypothetical protein
MSEQKIVYRGNDTFFYNSQCLFIEYHDVIAMPWFTMLLFTKNTNAFKKFFKLEEIEDYGVADLLEWYIYRKHRNVFKSIGMVDGVEELPDEGYKVLLEKAMNISEDIYQIDTNLKFLTTLRLLLTESNMVKQIIIYSEQNEPMIEKTLSKYFSKLGTKVKYMTGNFLDMVKLIPQDSTYVLSDIEKINDLIKADKLNLSTVLITNGLRYNYLEDDPSKLKVNMDEISQKYLFKYSFFDNFDTSDILGSELLPNEM